MLPYGLKDGMWDNPETEMFLIVKFIFCLVNICVVKMIFSVIIIVDSESYINFFILHSELALHKLHDLLQIGQA